MNKINVAILFGGKSGEHEVSIVSAASVYKALDKNKYDVTLIGIDKNGRWLTPEDSQLLANTQNPRSIKLDQHKNSVTMIPYKSQDSIIPVNSQASKKSAFDVVIPILHGTYGEDGTMQGLLVMAQVASVGSGVVGSAVGMDKDVSRRLLAQAKIPVVPTIKILRHEFLKDPQAWMHKCSEELGLPFFIKPANAGSSVGVHKIKSLDTAMEKFQDAFSFDTKVLAEKSIAARELECSVLGNNEPKASIVGEIIPNHEFYTYEAKYLDENGADLKIPAVNLTPQLTERIQKLSIEAFKVLELRGLARVDFFLDKNTGELYLNEVNTIPGFTSISMYPKLWEATGLAYPKLLDELIRLAIEHKQERLALRTSYES